jgi:transposase
MLTMAQINSIRQLFFEKGLGYAEIARVTGFDVKTVKKYVHMEDFNQPLPKPRQIRGSKLDKYKEQIDEWMVACFRHNRNTENGSENVTGEIED